MFIEINPQFSTLVSGSQPIEAFVESTLIFPEINLQSSYFQKKCFITFFQTLSQNVSLPKATSHFGLVWILGPPSCTYVGFHKNTISSIVVASTVIFMEHPGPR